MATVISAMITVVVLSLGFNFIRVASALVNFVLIFKRGYRTINSNVFYGITFMVNIFRTLSIKMFRALTILASFSSKGL